jgi:hypothetical protein
MARYQVGRYGYARPRSERLTGCPDGFLEHRKK